MSNKSRGRSFIRLARPARDRNKGDYEQQPAEPEPRRPRTERPQDVSLRRADDHTRIVVPRQERGGGRSELDIELREVRPGATARMPYLRVVPRQQPFTRVGAGYIEATRLASQPRGRIERFVQNIKGVALGSPFASSQAIHERLTKVKALPIFSSDALSSSAYGPEETLLALAAAGTGALIYALPIAGLIVFLLAIVTISYRQTIKAYPSGGGAYIVAHDNLGRRPGLAAAGALMVDYVLTVSVSVAAGVAAITSAAPGLQSLAIPIAVAVVGIFTLGNLRGLRESGTLFSAPTYFFIVMMSLMIGAGLIKMIIGDAPGTLLHAAPPSSSGIKVTQGVTAFLLLRAFSSGASALTGVEAISNGVPAFKPPESENARTTLSTMALILGFLVLGVAYNAHQYGVVPSGDETVLSMLGKDIFGKNVLYYGLQAGTALVLFLAANTAFADFPRLSAILAADRFMPRQFSFRGDRLAFSNGIMLLAGAATILLVVFRAEVTNLIPLYAVGVFVSFTLSQSGMVRHWHRLREPGWRTSLAINAVGACATAIVAVIIAATKFTHGAWISILMMLLLMLLFTLIHRHYEWFHEKIGVDEDTLPVGVPAAVPLEEGGPRDHVIVPVDGINKIALGAIGVARELSSMVTAVHLTDDKGKAEEFRQRWSRAVPDVPLMIIESPYRAFVAPMLGYIEHLERTGGGRRVTIVLPSFKTSHWWERLLHNRDVLRLRPFLKDRPGLKLVDFEYAIHDGNGVGAPTPA